MTETTKPMRKIGVRDSDLAGAELLAPAEDAPPGNGHGPHAAGKDPLAADLFDFGADPVYHDECEPQEIPVPGLEGCFIRVAVASDGIAKGMNHYQRTEHAYKKNDRAQTVISGAVTRVDLAGLSAYKREHCIKGFRVLHKKSGVYREFSQSTTANRDVYRSWTGKFGDWVDAWIDRVNGWDTGGVEERESFP